MVTFAQWLHETSPYGGGGGGLYQRMLARQDGGKPIQWFINQNPWGDDNEHLQKTGGPMPNQHMQAAIDINGRLYRVNFIIDTFVVEGRGEKKYTLNNVPLIDFDVDQGSGDFARTGEGTPLTVFSAVLNAIKEYITKTKPKAFKFDPADPKLALQYERMAGELLNGEYVENPYSPNIYLNPAYAKMLRLPVGKPGAFVDELKQDARVKTQLAAKKGPQQQGPPPPPTTSYQSKPYLGWSPYDDEEDNF